MRVRVMGELKGVLVRRVLLLLRQFLWVKGKGSTGEELEVAVRVTAFKGDEAVLDVDGVEVFLDLSEAVREGGRGIRVTKGSDGPWSQ